MTNTLKPYLTIPLLETCNFKCVYCPPAGETYHTPKANFTLDKVTQVLETAQAVGMTKVRFSGGEPLLYPLLKEAIEQATDLGFEVVATRGTAQFFSEQGLPTTADNLFNPTTEETWHRKRHLLRTSWRACRTKNVPRWKRTRK